MLTLEEKFTAISITQLIGSADLVEILSSLIAILEFFLSISYYDDYGEFPPLKTGNRYSKNDLCTLGFNVA